MSTAAGIISKLRSAGAGAVVTLAILALAVSAVLGPSLRKFDDLLVDAFFRVRYAWQGPRASTEVILIALDRRTQHEIGRFGAGLWTARKPYYDQLRFLVENVHPSVLAYDIIFKDSEAGALLSLGSVSESAARLREIGDEISQLPENPREVLSSQTLSDLARLSAEQGDVLYMHRLAAVYESETFPVIFAFNLRGGWMESGATPEAWTPADIRGPDADGTVEDGDRIPYLLDLAIPPSAVHFPHGDGGYAYAPNANFPGLRLIDFVLLGAINVPPDRDGVTRRVPLVIGFEFDDPTSGAMRQCFIPSFSLLAVMHHLDIELPLNDSAPSAVEVWMGDRIELRAANGRGIRIPIDDHGCMQINFDARFDDYAKISFVEAAPSYLYSSEASRAKLADRIRSRLKDKAAVVGMVATGTTDIGATPLSDHTPNVVVHLQAISNMLNGSFIAAIAPRTAGLGMALLFLAFTGVCLVVRSARLPVAGLAGIALYLGVAYAGVHLNAAVLPVLQPIVYIALCAFGVVSYRYVTEERSRRTIRHMFRRMVSAEVLAYMEDHPHDVSLEGHRAEVTVFFSDVEEFTPISESLSASDLVRVMNMYFAPATDCIMDRRGYINKFVGDEIMAVWGAPAVDADHALNACRAALDQQRALGALNRDLQTNFGVELRVRMGLNSGDVVAGPMGSERRMEYTVMGDVVNLAARLEPANKIYGTAILMGSETAERIGDQLVLRRLDRLLVAGKSEAEEIFELVGEPDEIDADRRRAIARYEEALEHYRRRDWSAATGILEEITRGDPPSTVLLARVRQFQSDPPPDDWDGVSVYSKKD